LRPDFVLEIPEGRRILVEVKLTVMEDGSPERDGLRDVLAYLQDGQTLFKGRPHPHAIVAAWNAAGAPGSPTAQIQIANQRSMISTLKAAITAGQP